MLISTRYTSAALWHCLVVCMVSVLLVACADPYMDRTFHVLKPLGYSEPHGSDVSIFETPSSPYR